MVTYKVMRDGRGTILKAFRDHPSAKLIHACTEGYAPGAPAECVTCRAPGGLRTTRAAPVAPRSGPTRKFTFEIVLGDPETLRTGEKVTADAFVIPPGTDRIPLRVNHQEQIGWAVGGAMEPGPRWHSVRLHGLAEVFRGVEPADQVWEKILLGDLTAISPALVNTVTVRDVVVGGRVEEISVVARGAFPDARITKVWLDDGKEQRA